MTQSIRVAMWTGLAVLVTLARIAAGAQAAAAAAGRHGDGWNREQLAVLASLRLEQLPPMRADPSNAYERSPAAIELGRALFADARFSRNGAVSCSSCHDPRREFQDGRPVGMGVGTGSRRAMTLVDAGHATWLFWDGRKDSLWAQALGPLEDAVEHGGNRLQYAHLLQSHYADAYQQVFGPMTDLRQLPANASPLGTAAERSAWQTLDARTRADVSRIFANLGKAVAAYEKTLRHSPSRVDRYLGETVAGVSGRSRDAASVLSASEVNGLRLFIGKAQCVSCHGGALFTDGQFHNTGVPPRGVASADRGRAAALTQVRQDEFNCLGPFSDAQPSQCGELQFMSEDVTLEGAFKTPSLRGAALRPPYMHAGQFTTLAEVVRHYVDAPRAAVGRSELAAPATLLHAKAGSGAGRPPIQLSDAEQRDLVAFLEALSAPAQ